MRGIRTINWGLHTRISFIPTEKPVCSHTYTHSLCLSVSLVSLSPPFPSLISNCVLWPRHRNEGKVQNKVRRRTKEVHFKIIHSCLFLFRIHSKDFDYSSQCGFKVFSPRDVERLELLV